MYKEFLSFPKDFAWGVATASYQVEGAVNEDGRGPSIWDTFSHTPGKIDDGKNGDRAVDQYHRYPEDIAIMQHLGLKNYRMSLAWPRILPAGKGNVEERGLDFYDRFIDALLEADITPWLTLYHWDLPQAMQDLGGWANRAVVDAFENYADIATRRYGDRVKNWMSFNEPWVASVCGNLFGVHAPGLKDIKTTLAVAHGILLAHGRSVPIVHSNVSKGKIGIVNNLAYVEAASTSEKDQEAARRWDGAFNRWYMDPVFRGSYPEDMLKWFGKLAPEIKPGDMESISAPTDFLGVNYYTRRLVAHDEGNEFLKAKQVYRYYTPRAEFEEFEDWPEALYKVLLRVRDEYGNLPVYVTENGTTTIDTVSEDGCVHDPVRVDYLRRHFAATLQAQKEGADVRGYFVWSLIDNFEWGFGFSKRFGIVYADYEDDVRRILKDSAHFYANVIRKNGFNVGNL
ncbi:GH1 family beta-glucosidase [Treponema sp.]